MIGKYFLVKKIKKDFHDNECINAFLGCVGKCVYVYNKNDSPNIVLSLNDDKNLVSFFEDELLQIDINKKE